MFARETDLIWTQKFVRSAENTTECRVQATDPRATAEGLEPIAMFHNESALARRGVFQGRLKGCSRKCKDQLQDGESTLAGPEASAES